jgi:hypothetical protein
MVNTLKSLIPPLLLAGFILLVGCSGSPSNPAPAPVQTPVQAASQATADNVTPVAAQPGPPLPNRVDVIYFHVNQRCVTCLCFEQHINTVIETYFQDAINSGKLTYRVLNLQKAENAAIARKYGAVGSQMFMNVVIKGVDNIEDIQSIWNWKCPGDPRGFELRVKNIIEQSLQELP